MKKGWKIALISLGSLVGLAAVAVAAVLWLVFTPKQLTKIVNSVVDGYVQAEVRFESVDLSLFKTWPDAGLRVGEVCIVNPTEGTLNDTLARLGSLTLGVDVKRFLKENEVVVHQVLVDDLNANLYIAADGRTNFDIFPSSDDTTPSSFSLDSLPQIDLKKIKIDNIRATLIDQKDGLDAKVDGLDLKVAGRLREGKVDATVDLDGKEIALGMKDSTGASSLEALLQNLELDLKGNGNLDAVAGQLKLKLADGRFMSGGTQMVCDRLAASDRDLLVIKLPFDADLRRMRFKVDEGKVELDGAYGLFVDGEATLATDEEPLTVDAKVATDGQWQVDPLLALLPEEYVGFKKDMQQLDAKVQLSATAKGHLTDSTMPLIDAQATIADGRFYMPKSLPYKIDRIGADLEARLDLGKGGVSNATIHSLRAHTRNTNVSLKGKVDDLLGDLRVDASIQGTIPIADAEPLLTDSLPFEADGTAKIDLHANFKLSQIESGAYDKLVASGNVKLGDVSFSYDSMKAVIPDLDIAIQLPAKEHPGKLGEVHLVGSALNFEMANIGLSAVTKGLDINVGLNDITKEQVAAAFEVSLGKTTATLDSNYMDLSALSVGGSVKLDSTQTNPIRKFSPNVDVDMRQTTVRTPAIAEAIYFNNLDFHYGDHLCEIADADVKMGNSDFQLYGSVQNLEQWLDHTAMLTGELQFTSDYTDVDQVLDLVSGIGSDADTLEQMRQEDSVPSEANPFIVPKDVDFTLNTHIKRSRAFGNDLGDLAGAITVRDGIAVLDQIGFVCKAATMQLTAMYSSPRPSHLNVSLDFHLLDILIDELIDMIPTIDTLVPMLADFDGKADFHLVASTFLDARYQPLMSSLRGAAAITGKDLTVMDNKSVAQIAKLMQFKSWKEKDNKLTIDSLDVELTCLNSIIEVYPFLLNVGKYRICASGMHSLDNQCGYHVELLKNPFLAKVGVDIKGDLSSPKITLGQVRYADYYKPDKQGVVEKQTLELKRQLKEALEAKVR